MKRRYLVALVLGVLLVGLALAWAAPTTRRRTQLVLLKGVGKIPDLTWREVFQMMPGRNGNNIDALVRTRNPYEAIRNPFPGPTEVAAGAESFRTRCAACHGANAHGGTGPDLSKSDQYRHGASDWALFQTIARGVPGTPMLANPLPQREVWQLVGYVRQVAGAGADRNASRPAPAAPLDITFDRIRDAGRDSANWLTYSGTLDGQRHSRLAQVNRSNVARLRIKWLFQLTHTDKFETTPLVVGTTMYVTSPPAKVWALDTRTGARLWSFSRPMPNRLRLCCGAVNRGLAVLGNTLYLGTLDAHLVALDAGTGAVKWIVKVAEHSEGYSITGAPLAVDGKIIVGVGGGEFAIRGFLDAYDAETGQRVWRFNAVPGPGEPGHDTWGGDAWKTGGAPTWMTGSYDPELKLVYWGVGNPSPDYLGDVRPGDNLYSNSVLALDVDSGSLRWHYQFTPHDEHDWDATGIMVLVDTVLGGRPRKLLLQANRNGFYYVLDRETGRFLSARPFVRQTWNTGFDSAGRPSVRPGSGPSRQGTEVYPGAQAANWWASSYAARFGLVYVMAVEQGMVFFKGPDADPKDGGMILGSGGQPSAGDPLVIAVRALNATTGALRWEYLPPVEREYVVTGGLMSTAGGLVFGGVESRLFALDAETGAELWWLNTGGMIHAAPITYLSEGRQQVTVASGQSIITLVVSEP